MKYIAQACGYTARLFLHLSNVFSSLEERAYDMHVTKVESKFK